MTWKISEMMTSKARKSKTNDWANCFMTYPCCYGSPLLYSVPFFDFIIQNIGHDFFGSSLSSEQKIIREWGVLQRNYIKTLLSKVIMMEKASIHFCCFIFQQKVQTKPKNLQSQKKRYRLDVQSWIWILNLFWRSLN